jgi:hypothetical protein
VTLSGLGIEFLGNLVYDECLYGITLFDIVEVFDLYSAFVTGGNLALIILKSSQR